MNLIQAAVFSVVFFSATECREIAESSQCATAKNTKAETYLETAASLIDKVRDNFPDDQPDCSCPKQPMDCEEVQLCGNNRSGVYQIWPRNRVLWGGPVNIFCDMDTDGGGWTVIQRRGGFQRAPDFFQKPWYKYKSGFGDLQRDFWLGNENIYALSNQRRYYLRIEMVDFKNESRHANYDQFWIDNEAQNYKLHAEDYSGDAGDALFQMHNNVDFSTYDRDNDRDDVNCARDYNGGWWFANCLTSNLNGLYLENGDSSTGGIVWSDMNNSLQKAEMKVKPVKIGFLEMDVEAA